MNDLLQATLSGLQNGLTSLPLGSAMDNTETWQQQFLQSGQPEFQDIAREMGNLQSLLSSGSLSPTAIGNSLSMLGDQTSQASQHAPADLKADLLKLADTLRRHGAELLAHKAAK
jgi:hypothetical protein